ncbi:hypothetical protein Glove_51g79 [Diversispora epigaea]|uniref:Uncharacterized protein n=1 Tax=Diversispora epigaea TaxID=1348612 RepID=A0A397JDQ1_9GLOM|nr:hypothetical protein Glove_51g79 [Diversispora epigaea]
MYPPRQLYEWILLLFLMTAFTLNLFNFIWAEIPTNKNSLTHISEIELKDQNFDSDLILEYLFAPAENFISPHLIDIEINQSFCHRSKCKFLFMYKTIERKFDDEFNAQRHFQMFINFTRQLNRIMVLPNVGESHISVCGKHSFKFYYSIENLKEMYPDVSFMLQSDFLRWTKERYIKPSVIQTTIIERRGNGKHSLQPQLVDVEDLKDRNCLREFNFDYETVESNIITLEGKYWDTPDHLKETNEFMINNMMSDVEVILFDHNLNFNNYVQEKTEPIKYSNSVMKKVSDIFDHLDPYIAIHWKMEQGEQKNMVMCAEGLIREIKKLKSRHNILNIYLATDYPLRNNLKQFYSFQNITRHHDKAIKTLKRKIKFKSWLSFNPQDPNGRNIGYKSFAESGIPGIIDKLVCTRAKIFLTAPPSCKNINSDYSKDIIQGREKLLEENENEEFINTVTQWAVYKN